MTAARSAPHSWPIESPAFHPWWEAPHLPRLAGARFLAIPARIAASNPQRTPYCAVCRSRKARRLESATFRERDERMRRRLATVCMVIGALAGSFGGAAFAAANPSGTGQPSQTCLSSIAPMEPGRASLAPGAAFNEPSATSSGGTAGAVYAGQQPQNSGNSHSVSQYDVACYQVSQH
jgi:hypothetical protein